MKRTHVGWSLGALAGLLLSIGVGPALAAEPDEGGELILNSEFMVMDSFGTDLNVFELKIEEDATGNSTNNGSEVEHDEDFGWRGDLQYKDGAWGLGISGFHFDNEGSESKFVRGDQLDETGRNEVSLRTAGTSFDCNEAFGDDDTGNCIGRVDSELKVWMVDLYGIRELVSTPDVGVDLQFGLRIADYEWDVDTLAAIVGERSGGTFPLLPDRSGSNPVTSNSKSDTDDPLVGPFMSLMTTGRYGRFRVDGQLTQAVVFGQLDQSLRRTQYLEENDGGTTLADLMFEEAATFGQDQDAVIPITDVRIKLGYDILDSLTLGFGAYATTWFNVPEPPNVEAIDRTIGNSSISSDEENLTFLGASFSIEYRFGGGGMPDVGSWMP